MKRILGALVATVVMATAGGSIEVAQAPVASITTTKDFALGVNVQANQLFLNNRDWFETSATNNVAYGLGLQGAWTFYRSGDFSTAVEGRVTFTGMNTAEDFITYDALIKPEYAFGDFGVYALAGYTYADYNTAVDGFVWGVGTDYALTEEYSLFVDYTVRPTDVVKNEVVTVGFNYKF